MLFLYPVHKYLLIYLPLIMLKQMQFNNYFYLNIIWVKIKYLLFNNYPVILLKQNQLILEYLYHLSILIKVLYCKAYTYIPVFLVIEDRVYKFRKDIIFIYRFEYIFLYIVA